MQGYGVEARTGTDKWQRSLPTRSSKDLRPNTVDTAYRELVLLRDARVLLQATRRGFLTKRSLSEYGTKDPAGSACGAETSEGSALKYGAEA